MQGAWALRAVDVGLESQSENALRYRGVRPAPPFADAGGETPQRRGREVSFEFRGVWWSWDGGRRLGSRVDDISHRTSARRPIGCHGRRAR